MKNIVKKFDFPFIEKYITKKVIKMYFEFLKTKSKKHTIIKHVINFQLLENKKQLPNMFFFFFFFFFLKQKTKKNYQISFIFFVFLKRKNQKQKQKIVTV